MKRKKKQDDEKVQIEFSLPKSVYEDFEDEFNTAIISGSWNLIGLYSIKDLLVFYLKKLFSPPTDLFQIQEDLLSIMEDLGKIGVPIKDFDDLITKLEIIKKISRKLDGEDVG